MPKSPQPDTFAALDLGQLADVTGGCGGHKHRRRQRQDPYGGGGYPGSDDPYEVTTNVDIDQQGQSIIRR
ncbi:MAG: hypothetical protein KF773_16310 [Deltaproteobacteria bacterium]|nr:hypothetical protein [Deltaproteobacteria bacterium]MCW5803731.1 hypothetical protein [Deltaproteobacteria bacterium]